MGWRGSPGSGHWLPAPVLAHRPAANLPRGPSAAFKKGQEGRRLRSQVASSPDPCQRLTFLLPINNQLLSNNHPLSVFPIKLWESFALFFIVLFMFLCGLLTVWLSQRPWYVYVHVQHSRQQLWPVQCEMHHGSLLCQSSVINLR